MIGLFQLGVLCMSVESCSNSCCVKLLIENIKHNFDQRKLYKYLRVAFETCYPREVIFQFITPSGAKKMIILHKKSPFIYPNIFQYIFYRCFFRLELDSESTFDDKGMTHYDITINLKNGNRIIPKGSKVKVLIAKD